MNKMVSKEFRDYSVIDFIDYMECLDLLNEQADKNTEAMNVKVFNTLKIVATEIDHPKMITKPKASEMYPKMLDAIGTILGKLKVNTAGSVYEDMAHNFYSFAYNTLCQSREA